jgi:putative oxidoreductase
MSPRAADNCGRSGKDRRRDSPPRDAHIHLAAASGGTVGIAAMWAFLSKNRDAGLLMLRLMLGALFIWAHGWSLLAGGTKEWHKLGGAMEHLGITFGLTFWGFVAMFAETAGVALFIIGLAFRPACLLIAATMAVAGLHDWHGHKTVIESLKSASHAWELGLVFFSMMFVGPGKYSVDKN